MIWAQESSSASASATAVRAFSRSSAMSDSDAACSPEDESLLLLPPSSLPQAVRPKTPVRATTTPRAEVRALLRFTSVLLGGCWPRAHPATGSAWRRVRLRGRPARCRPPARAVGASALDRARVVQAEAEQVGVAGRVDVRLGVVLDVP